jgi:hypothetical protein
MHRRQGTSCCCALFLALGTREVSRVPSQNVSHVDEAISYSVPSEIGFRVFSTMQW